MKKILEVKNICKTYQSQNGEIEALKNISFDIKEGKYISIIGPVSMLDKNNLNLIEILKFQSLKEF